LVIKGKEMMEKFCFWILIDGKSNFLARREI
jgi:hypothetical protein